MLSREEIRAEIERLRSKISLPPWVKAKTFEGARYRGDILSACKGHPQKPVAEMLGQQDYDERVANADLVCLLMSNLDTILAALSRSDPDQDAIETDPCRRSGIPVLKGTRFTVAQIVAEIAETTAPDDLAERFETLDASTVRRGLEELALRLDRPNALSRSDPDAVAAARAPLPTVEFHQQDWIPGFAAFLPRATTPQPNSRAFCVVNLGSLLATVATGDVGREDLPYFLAESMMHEVIHVIEQWAGTEFSEERVEALLEKYRDLAPQESTS